MNDLTFIVLDIDGGEMLARCVESMRRQTVRPDRIIILDNGSNVPSWTRISGPDLLLARSDTNMGFAGGINEAMKDVTTRFVAWINNDVVLAPEWAERVLSAVSASDDIAGAQSIVMRPDRRIDGAGISVDGTISQIGHGQTIDHPLPEEIWGVSATAALYRTEALHSIAVNGEILLSSLFAWYEDVELCARLRKGGFRFALVPEALAIHEGSKSAAVLPRSGLALRTRNRYVVHGLHKEIGNFKELLNEDLRRVGGFLIRGHLISAMVLAREIGRALIHRAGNSRDE